MKYKKKSVALTSFILIISLFIWGFGKNSNNIRKIAIHFNMPVINDRGDLLNISDSLCIFYENDFVLHRFSIVQDNFVNDVFINQIIKHQFFGFKNGEENGIYYDSLNVKKLRYYSVDSILTVKAFKKMRIFYNDNEILVEKGQSDNGQINEKYICKVKKGFSYPDTTFVYYSDKLKNIEYSFSRELDSLKGKKVQKIVLLYNAQQYAGMPIKFPERRLSFEMNEVPITNLEEVKSLFERLKEDYKALKK